MTNDQIKKEIANLEKQLGRLNAKKEGSTPEARTIRRQLRDLGHYVSHPAFDTREGKPKKKFAAPKPTVKKKK